LDGYWVAKVEYFDDQTSAPSRECQQLMRRILNKLINILTEQRGRESDEDSEEDKELTSPQQQQQQIPPPPPHTTATYSQDCALLRRRLNEIPKVQEWIEQYGPMPSTPKEFSHWISCAFTTSNEIKQEVRRNNVSFL
jgi:hypothetical protein